MRVGLLLFNHSFSATPALNTEASFDERNVIGRRLKVQLLLLLSSYSCKDLIEGPNMAHGFSHGLWCWEISVQST